MIRKFNSIALMLNKICQQSLLLVTLSLLNNSHIAQAQLIPVADTTLGSENSQVIPIGINNHIIQGGASRGNNLFHSFKEFNVDNGRGVFFINPSGIDNIIGRVTGTNVSNILGNLGVLDNSFNINNANLFLINPNGIYFGANARLFLGGSFVASTADGLLFDNGFEFSASHPNIPPLMTVNIPVGLQFRETAGNGIIQPINVEGSLLRVASGKTLALVGGDISVTGGRLITGGGQVEIGGISESGIVNLNTNENILFLEFPDDVARANVSLTNASTIDVRAGNGGSIKINANNLDILGGSSVLAGIANNLGSVDSKAGDITLDATGDIKIGQLSRVRNDVSTNAIGNAGNIKIKANSFLLEGGSFVLTSIFGTGNTGNIDIKVNNLTSLDGSYVSTNISQNGIGNSGNIVIASDDLLINNSSQVASNISGQGNGGNIIFKIGNTTSVNQSFVFARVEQGGIGNGGSLSIDTNSLSVTNNSQISLSTSGVGNTGLIKINATDNLVLDQDSSILNSVAPNSIGNSSGIEINANSLTLTNGSYLSSSTFGKGNGGFIKINTEDTVLVDGIGKTGKSSRVDSSVATGGLGNGGVIEILTNSLILQNRGSISSSSNGQGNAGLVKIQADKISLDGRLTGIGNIIGEQGIGNSGGIDINTGSLTVTSGAEITSGVQGQGTGGNIKITATDDVIFSGEASNGAPSALITSLIPGGRGVSGGIEIIAKSLTLENGGILSSGTVGEGNAGPVTINVSDNLLMRGVGSVGVSSGIYSTVEFGAVGNGGNISITANSFQAEQGAAISSTTFSKGNAGNIKLKVNDQITFDGVGTNGQGSGLQSRVFFDAEGNGGNIDVFSKSVSAINGAQITASTMGIGNAGNIKIQAQDAILFDGIGIDGLPSGLFTIVGEGAIGKGGDISIITDLFSVINEADVNNSTLGEGNAGNLKIDVGRLVVNNFGRIAASTASDTGQGGNINIKAQESVNISQGAGIQAQTFADGNAGNVTLETRRLSLESGGKIAVTTQGRGDAGNINLKVSDNINLTGKNSGIFANTTTYSTGKGGNIFIDPITVSVENGAAIAVDSQGSGIGGDIDLFTQNLFLDNGKISATTASNTGGNINLQVANYSLLRNNSLISTTAGSEGGAGAGGNISIDTKFLIAVPSENSDITANSFGGQGGKINITSEGIFGLEIRNQLTPFSDITAFSQLDPTLNGQIILNIPETDPSNDLTELPESVVDPDQLIAQNPCKQGKGSQFVSTGRGGLPPSPEQAVGNNFTQIDLVEPVTTGKQKPDNWQVSSQENHSQPITPVRGWTLNEKGQLILTAYDPKSNFEQRQNQKPSSCNQKN